MNFPLAKCAQFLLVKTDGCALRHLVYFHHQLLDCSAAQAATFETTTRHDKGTSPTTGDARPVYTTRDELGDC